jgi:putative addiction module component (TIGR02574 family)
VPITLEQFGLDTLTPDDRLVLAGALWDSVYDAVDQAPVPPGLQAELERRLALADADPGRGIPWEQVRAEARARWAK